MKWCWPLVWVFLLAWSIYSAYPQAIHAQTDSENSANTDQNEAANQILTEMSTSDRIGQLFLVSFQGDRIDENNEIVNLVADLQVGGVVLLPENDNFRPDSASSNGLDRLLTQNNILQELALTGDTRSLLVTDVLTASITATVTPELPTPQFGSVEPNRLPLFIAIPHDDPALAVALDGLTDRPSPTALGATWQPALVMQAGEIVGREISQLGFNMILDVSLDVIDAGTPNGPSRLSSFGESPFWVGEMGDAYIQGLKIGGAGRLNVIAGRFPGSGSSDRPIGVDIATVYKTYDQLLENELLPFTIATDGSMSPISTTVDGFTTAHIRYQGIQGNINASTVPISFDPEGLEQLLQLPSIADWRLNGGLLISEGLGVDAVRKFYSTAGPEFPHRSVAKDAFLAGNDILYVHHFAADTPSDPVQEAENIRDTISWFSAQYEADPSFRVRVDDAVLRIIKSKLALYGGDFSLENVLLSTENLPGSDATAESDMFSIARESATQLFPAVSENSEPLPQISAQDKLVIFTDIRTVQRCSDCPPEPLIGLNDLADGIVAQYGPEGSGQIQPDQIVTYSFSELLSYLEGNSLVRASDLSGEPVPPPTQAPITPEPLPSATLTNEEREAQEDDSSAPSNVTPTVTPTVTPLPTATPVPVRDLIEADLSTATWIVVALDDLDPDLESAFAFKRLLNERPETLRNKVVVAFAFDLPITLDSTEISKLSAYYALYSTGNVFEDVAVRILFRDLPVRGALPLSVQPLNYNLSERTRPDPAQVIPLEVIGGLPNDEDLTTIFEAFQLVPGDTIRLQTGLILDYNGNPVPDGTMVTFYQEDRVEGFDNIIEHVPTQNGVAVFAYVLENRVGQFRLRVEAGDANQSELIDIAIEEDEGAQVVIATPTPQPTDTPPPTETPSPTVTPRATPTPIPTPTPPPPAIDNEPRIVITYNEMRSVFSMLIGIGMVMLTGSRFRRMTAENRLRFTLWGISSGLVGYIYMWLDLPGFDLFPDGGMWRWGVIVLLFALPGFLLAVGYNRLQHWLDEN